MSKKKLLLLVLTAQLFVLGLVGLEALGFDIPIIQQFIGFIYLTFIPGLLILRILKLPRLGTINTLLYSMGLSLAFVMFVGLFMSLVFPILGITKPISLLPVISTITFLILIFSVIVYKQKEIKPPLLVYSIDWSKILLPATFFLILLPIVAILGGILVRVNHGNVLLLVLFPLIAMVPILVVFNKFIHSKLYPIAIMSISLSLLLPNLLMSPSLSGFDIHCHYWVQYSVLANAIWSPLTSSALNSMLSIAILAPLYSLILHLDAVWIFKIVYGLCFSLVPLALFQVYRKQMDDKIAFFGVFFFMLMPTFAFNVVGASATQTIAEIFLALTMLTLLIEEINLKVVILCLIFSFFIIFSHYSVTYFYIVCLFLSFVIIKFWRRLQFPKGVFCLKYIISLIGVCLIWYMFTSQAANFDTIVQIGVHVISNIGIDFLSPQARDIQILQAIGLAPMRGNGIVWGIARIVQYVTQLFIIIGALWLLMNFRQKKFHSVYVVMSLASSLILGLCIIVPNITEHIAINRIYHLTLFFLAPLCIIGGGVIFRWFFRIFPRLHSPVIWDPLNIVVVIVLIPYLLFSSGFMFEITRSPPTSMALSSYKKADWGFFIIQEMQSRDWLVEKLKAEKNSLNIYADAIGVGLLWEKLGSRAKVVSIDALQEDPSSLIFLRYWNLTYGEMLLYISAGALVTPMYVDIDGNTELSNIIHKSDIIYDNGYARILRTRCNSLKYWDGD